MKNILIILFLFISTSIFSQDFGEIFSYKNPIVVTIDATEITQTTAKTGLNLIANGGAFIERAVLVWDTITTIDYANPLGSVFLFQNTAYTGENYYTLTGLQSCKTYYVSCYADRYLGSPIADASGSLGNTISFTTECSSTLPIVTTIEPMYLSTTSATSGGNVSSDGGANVTARGVCWATHASPDITDSKTTSGSGTGVFTSTMSGLTAGTLYYVRAYATNSVGTAYGEEFEYQGLTLPNVYLFDNYNITQSSANIASIIMSTGHTTLTDKGICWKPNTAGSPTLSDSVYSNGSGGIKFDQYVSIMSDLTASTTYKVRPYATNSVGTYYGNEITITTESGTLLPPTVTTDSIADYNDPNPEFANFYGNVRSDGGDPIIRSGFVYNTTGNPTLTNTILILGEYPYEGSYFMTANLECGTHYYVCAYSENSTGVGYGDVLEFTTDTPSSYVVAQVYSYITGTCDGTPYDLSMPSQANAIQACDNYTNCGFDTFEGFRVQAISFSAGYRLYNWLSDCEPFDASTEHGYYFATTDSGANTYILEISSDGMIISVTPCP